ncbi:hypothetical protein [Pantoea phage PA-1]
MIFKPYRKPHIKKCSPGNWQATGISKEMGVCHSIGINPKQAFERLINFMAGK